MNYKRDRKPIIKEKDNRLKWDEIKERITMTVKKRM